MVVISQVYGGGGIGSAPYRNDYVELHNRSASTVSLTNWSLQYSSTTSTGPWSVVALSGSIDPGGYYLVGLLGSGSGVNPLPTTQATGAFNMTFIAKLAVFNFANATTGACPADTPIDFVNLGGSNCTTMGGSGPASTTASASFRAAAGCTDTGTHASDFSLAAPAPRNASTAAAVCSTTGCN